MSARAMWKGVVTFADVRVPVKLYAAVADRSVHFRLLHAEDHVPVRQAMVNPATGEVVPYEEVRRAYVTEEHDWVMLDADDLAVAEPESSRDIEIVQFVPPGAIDHRWYRRPYYLGPDGPSRPYAALARALGNTGREGLARWSMRNKAYVGALRLHAGCPALVTLRHAGEVIPVEELEAPAGRELEQRELGMAQQLIGALASGFDPSEYRNEHRDRILELIETKRRGGSAKVVPLRRPEPTRDVASALEASLKRERKRA